MLNERRASVIILFLLTGASVTVLSITIDNQLQVIRNDCYERLAIGQRHEKKDVYRETDLKTVHDCQMECTQDEEKCRSFSFGIGVKGNASCQLSSYVVKETVDLKPIGTTDDTDFDLYIKKLGCKLVIDMSPDSPEYANDEIPLPHHLESSKPRPRPSYYKKHHGSFQYGSEQQSYNSESHWSMKKMYKGSRPVNYDDRAVSYNRYDKPGGFSYEKPGDYADDKPGGYSYDKPADNSYDKPGDNSYDKPNKYGYQEDDPNSYDNSDKFSFTNPYDDIQGPTYYKPSNNYNPSEKDKYKPANSNYGDEKTPNSNYDSKPSSGYDAHNNKPNFDYVNEPSLSGYGSPPPNKKPNYSTNPKPPIRPSVPSNPYGSVNNDNPYNPDRPFYPDPDNPNYESPRPIKPPFGENGGYGDIKPYKPPKPSNSGGYHYQKPSNNYGKPTEFDSLGSYHYSKPDKPSYGGDIKPVMELNSDMYEYPKRPIFPSSYGLYGNLPNRPGSVGNPYENEYNGVPEMYGPKYPYQSPIIETHVDEYGHLVMSVITEIGKVCFRRALAGKRVSRIYVRKAVSCERVEHCQQECAEEKRFICEGFNYRLDPNGHGRGDCELLDVPYIRLDLRRDIIPNPDYDYYEKDRNCKEQRPPPYRPLGGDRLPGPPRPVSLNEWQSGSYYDRHSSLDRFRDRYDERATFDRRGPEYDHDLRPPLPKGPYNRRSDYFEESYSSRNKYEDHYNSYDYNYPVPPSSFGKDYDYKHNQGYLPPRDSYDYTNKWIKTKYYVKPYYHKAIDDEAYYNKWGTYAGNYGNFGKDSNSYGYIDSNNDFKGTHYNIPAPTPPKDWGKYGGTYGTGTGGYYNYQTKDYWELNKVGGHKSTSNYNFDPPLEPPKPSLEYLPPTSPPSTGYVPAFTPDTGYSYPKPELPNGDVGYPAQPSFTFVNECSLRSATGYRLYKSIVKKIITIPTIYDCEYACFKEKDFLCTSYAFRYVGGADIPPNNCYLSNKNYKELDYYTDLEQDRNFDIYTMNNRDRCNGGTSHHRDSSECFLHVRSGQRLNDNCAKDIFTVKSIVDCELACLKSERFICRTFSFRYGSPIIGGIADNCQLSDIPYHELDPRHDFIFDPGFVIYERASFGYGCELNQLPNVQKPKPTTVSLSDEICYVGFGWPAKLSPQAIKRALRVVTEAECKAECTKARMETPFCCMTFSYKAIDVKDEANCLLSDIFQRDLLVNIDYIRDADYWLFSWDNTNPHCNFPGYYDQRLPFNIQYDHYPGSLTWRIYSVGGWPCKRGSYCKQSELGFWFCELEGGSPSAWDYCCRPKHQCGYSEGFPYQWCYVGASSTQWRKCNDKYYPYLPSSRPQENHTPSKFKPTYAPHIPAVPLVPNYGTKPPTYAPSTFIPPPNIHVEPPKKTYLPPAINQPRPWITTGRPYQGGLQALPSRPGFRPDRPQAAPPPYKPKPSLDDYEEQFDDLFLDPPKPGGFGQARHWPVSYLHKEMPPNASTSLSQKYQKMRTDYVSPKPRLEAIENLIEVIKSNDLNNIKYEITNASGRTDDVLHVQIPLPNKFPESMDQKKEDTKLIGKPIDIIPPTQTFEKVTMIENDPNDLSKNQNIAQKNARERNNLSRSIYRRGFIEKANVTDYGSSVKFLRNV